MVTNLPAVEKEHSRTSENEKGIQNPQVQSLQLSFSKQWYAVVGGPEMLQKITKLTEGHLHLK